MNHFFMPLPRIPLGTLAPRTNFWNRNQCNFNWSISLHDQLLTLKGSSESSCLFFLWHKKNLVIWYNFFQSGRRPIKVYIFGKLSARAFQKHILLGVYDHSGKSYSRNNFPKTWYYWQILVTLKPYFEFPNLSGMWLCRLGKQIVCLYCCKAFKERSSNAFYDSHWNALQNVSQTLSNHSQSEM